MSEKSFARYETGAATQGFAMDNLLRVLRDNQSGISSIPGNDTAVFSNATDTTALNTDDIPAAQVSSDS